MIHRDDLRLAVCVGLAAGLGTISTVPDGYYLPLTLAAVMVGSYGGSYALGLQRVICTLLGGLLLLIAQPALTSLPFPIGLALMLGVIRLLGGCLGLQAGYKITGMVVVMGWLMQPTAVDSWLGLKLSWTLLGVVLALLALHLFWPSTAIREQQRAFVNLLELQHDALEEQRELLLHTVGSRLTPVQRKQRHRELMRALVHLQSTRSAAILELGANPYGQPLLHLWQELDRFCAGLAGCITALRALRQVEYRSPALQALQKAEAQLLEECTAQLSRWIEALRYEPLVHQRRLLLEGCHLQERMERLRLCERALFEQPEEPSQLDPAQFRHVARRCLLVYQVAALLQRSTHRWLELFQVGSA
jgi:hypothetical protein